MVNGFTQQYEAYLSQPRLSDYLNQYTLDQNKDTGTLLSVNQQLLLSCLLYTSDAADERSSVDLGGRRIVKKKNNK